MIEIIINNRALHKERHQHHCPIHGRNKCLHKDAVTVCPVCLFQEDNEICQKTLRGTGLDYHDFPCVNCMTMFRNQYGGETLVDALIGLEEAARHAHVVPDKREDESEENRAQTDPAVEELVDARKRI